MVKKSESTKRKRGHTYVQWMVAILANTTLLTYGLQAGWISPMTKVLKSALSPTNVPLLDDEISMIASMMCLSAIFGAFGYAYIADAYGRRVGVISIALLQAISWIIKMCFPSKTGLLIARIVCGLPAGGCFNIIPMYVKEISQDDMRGILGSLLILMQNVGVLTMYAIGSYLEYQTVLRIALIVPIVTIVFMLKAPESPAFLVKKGMYEEAISTVALLRGLDMCDKEVQNEIISMRNEEASCQSLPSVSYLSILRNKAWRRGFVLSLVIMSISACNGNFAIVTHAAAILSTSGVGVSPELQTLSFPAVLLLGSFLSMACVERVGRKVILSTAFSVAAVSLVTVASCLLLEGVVPVWLPILAIILSLCAYAAGVSPIPYIIITEMFNFQIRAKVLGFVVTYSWFMSFVQLAAFAPMSAALGTHWTFYIFAGINLLGAVVSLVFLPETKGKSIEDIDLMLRKK
ncbi:facilitated trehalose transporter Tret1 [Manduca sexta]|uniref:facilitated trehalose transporter Tret1 n=1 Tax=Manduca sexta TaxID=7130 RepID=UPI00188E28AC|nr:facilitated trehalose transporter Tret1 [Manduca sexta]